MKSFYTYILRCADNSYYTGHTDDLEKRLAEHRLGELPCYTATRLPVHIVYVQEFATRDEALLGERTIKKWSRKKKDALINNDFKLLSLLSKKKFV